jgi:hypothetical protein
MAFTIELNPRQDVADRPWNPPAAIQFGGLVVLEYLTNLFEDSPKELFSRVDVLALLDAVAKDRALYPASVVTNPGHKTGRRIPSSRPRLNPMASASITLP